MKTPLASLFLVNFSHPERGDRDEIKSFFSNLHVNTPQEKRRVQLSWPEHTWTKLSYS
jgi:hypothetical protein